MLNRLAAAALAAALLPAVAAAQLQYPEPGNPSARIPSVVLDCVNPSGQAVPASAATPCPVQSNPWLPVSAGASQFGLAIGTNTALTVPANSKCAQISIEGASVRYTDDGSSASASVGQPAFVNQQFTYCGPLAALKFTAVTGSPTLNVSYYK